jgi:hypothetical protein
VLLISLAGQILPLKAVYTPQSKLHKKFLRKRLKSFVHWMFLKQQQQLSLSKPLASNNSNNSHSNNSNSNHSSMTVQLGKAGGGGHSKSSSSDLTSLPTVKMRDVQVAFPNTSDPLIRKKLKPCATFARYVMDGLVRLYYFIFFIFYIFIYFFVILCDFYDSLFIYLFILCPSYLPLLSSSFTFCYSLTRTQNCWVMKKDFKLETEEEIRKKTTPEEVVLHECMHAGLQRLQGTARTRRRRRLLLLLLLLLLQLLLVLLFLPLLLLLQHLRLRFILVAVFVVVFVVIYCLTDSCLIFCCMIPFIRFDLC